MEPAQGKRAWSEEDDDDDDNDDDNIELKVLTHPDTGRCILGFLDAPADLFALACVCRPLNAFTEAFWHDMLLAVKLPLEVIIHEIFSYLWRAGTDILVSKEAREWFLPTIYSLYVKWDWELSAVEIDGLVSLLNSTTNLEYLAIISSCNIDDDKADLLVEAVVSDQMGSHLESLKIDGFESTILNHLKRGRLPHLCELEIYMDWESEAYVPEEDYYEPMAPYLVTVLEARQELGLPPITSLRGLKCVDVEILQRLWDCCPVEEITHLEAHGGEQIQALVLYMRRVPMFPALCSLHVNTRSESWQARSDITGIVTALCDGRTPMLEKFQVMRMNRADAVFAPLKRFIAEGGLPMLSKFWVIV